MSLKSSFFLLVLILCLHTNLFGQSHSEKNISTVYINSGIGVQMSGYKKVDFVKSNYSPVIDIAIGNWFAPSLSVQFGYNGYYFNTISNSDKRKYSYIFGKVIFNINELFSQGNKKNLSIYLHLGSGYFMNYYYQRPNICASLDLSLNFPISKRITLNYQVSSIMGWDIYQGNKDVLLSSKFSLFYQLKI